MNKFIFIIVLLISQNSLAQELGRTDLARLVEKLSSANACTIESVLDKLDDELFIKLIGNVLTAEGVPKTTSSRQSKFYYLALQSNDIPSQKDKDTLLKTLFQENCFTPDFQFDHPLLRQAEVEGVRIRQAVRRELLENKITYGDLAQKLGGLSNSQELTALLEASFEKNPDLFNKILLSSSRFSTYIEAIGRKYNVQLK